MNQFQHGLSGAEASAFDRCDRACAAVTRHWQNCPACIAAGASEWAPEASCPTGKAMSQAWEDAEAAYQERFCK